MRFSSFCSLMFFVRNVGLPDSYLCPETKQSSMHSMYVQRKTEWKKLGWVDWRKMVKRWRAEEFQSNHVTETKWRHFRPSPATLKKLASCKSRRKAKKGWEEQNSDRRKKKNKGTEEKMRFFMSAVGPVGTPPKYMWNNPFRPQLNRTKVLRREFSPGDTITHKLLWTLHFVFSRTRSHLLLLFHPQFHQISYEKLTVG